MQWTRQCLKIHSGCTMSNGKVLSHRQASRQLFISPPACLQWRAWQCSAVCLASNPTCLLPAGCEFLILPLRLLLLLPSPLATCRPLVPLLSPSPLISQLRGCASTAPWLASLGSLREHRSQPQLSDPLLLLRRSEQLLRGAAGDAVLRGEGGGGERRRNGEGGSGK